MNETPSAEQDHSSEEAVVQSSRRISKIWFIPLVALSIAMWMVYYQWSNQGPTITIEFESAAGIEADKTKIRTRDVEVGLVKKVALKSDLQSVIVTARIEKNAAHLLNAKTNFWIVRPRVSLSGVSGLSTLLSGPYITMDPGKLDENEEQEDVSEFVALEKPPVTPAGTPGLQITLNSDDEFAFKEGDPIIYKGLQVGEFDNIYFNVEERVVYYNAFIKEPYHKLITENTKFWNASGINLELAANGIEVKTGSLETLLTNGVTFGIPEGMPAGRQITQRAYFDIYKDYKAASDERYKIGVNFVILIKDTVRGLTVGAPVEYRGLEIGRVLEINLPTPTGNQLLDEGYTIPVLLTIQPSRVQLQDNREGAEFVRAQIMHWVNQGLRASLKMGNLLTGALYVDLQHYPDVEAVELETFLSYDIIPTTSGEIAQITQKVTSLLDRVNALPLNDISNNVNDLLTKLNDTSSTFQDTVNTLHDLLKEVKQQSTSANLNQTLKSLDGLLVDLSAGSRSHEELLNTMAKFQQTLEQLTPFLQQLNQTPNSLIFADGVQPVLEPKGRKQDATRDNNE